MIPKQGQDMPVVDNDGIEIYYTTEGNPENPPLLLLHWFMGSHQTWYDIGWVRVLEPYFYLVIVDHRGYGRSSKPHQPEAYQLVNHVSDLVQVLNQLKIEKTSIMGYSMGARIGFAMAVYAPDQLDKLILGGMHPFKSERIPTDLDKRIKLLEEGMEKTLTTYGIGPKEVFDRMMQNDAKALLADTIQTKQWPGFEEELEGFDRPTLLFVGKDDGFYDGMRETEKIMKQAHFVAFNGENHRTAFLKRTLLIPHLSRFLNVRIS